MGRLLTAVLSRSGPNAGVSAPANERNHHATVGHFRHHRFVGGPPRCARVVDAMGACHAPGGQR